MSQIFEVWLDEERQIIRQRLHAEPDLSQFMDIVAATDACASRLGNPDVIHILIDGDWSGHMGKLVRAAAADTLRKPELKRAAIVAKSAVVRIMIRFVRIATGLDKVRTFPDEATALAWLVS